MPRPYVVKPIDQGSSVGVHIVRDGDNLAARVGPLAVLHGQRQEVPAFHRGPRGDRGGQHHGAAAADDHGAVGLLGLLAGLDGE